MITWSWETRKWRWLMLHLHLDCLNLNTSKVSKSSGQPAVRLRSFALYSCRSWAMAVWQNPEAAQRAGQLLIQGSVELHSVRHLGGHLSLLKLSELHVGIAPNSTVHFLGPFTMHMPSVKPNRWMCWKQWDWTKTVFRCKTRTFFSWKKLRSSVELRRKSWFIKKKIPELLADIAEEKIIDHEKRCQKTFNSPVWRIG